MPVFEQSAELLELLSGKHLGLYEIIRGDNSTPALQGRGKTRELQLYSSYYLLPVVPLGKMLMEESIKAGRIVLNVGSFERCLSRFTIFCFEQDGLAIRAPGEPQFKISYQDILATFRLMPEYVAETQARQGIP